MPEQLTAGQDTTALRTW